MLRSISPSSPYAYTSSPPSVPESRRGSNANTVALPAASTQQVDPSSDRIPKRPRSPSPLQTAYKRSKHMEQSGGSEASSVASQSGASSVRRTSPDAESEENAFSKFSPAEQDIIKQIYLDNLYLHGTSGYYKEEIRFHGMDIEMKEGGATLASQVIDKGARRGNASFSSAAAAEAASFNYLASSAPEGRALAKRFAKLGSREDPALVRILGSAEKLSLEMDPHVKARPFGGHAFRTPNLIPPGHILPSNKDKIQPEAITFFQEALKRAGIEVSHDVAEDCLETVQSASSQDFTPPPSDK